MGTVIVAAAAAVAVVVDDDGAGNGFEYKCDGRDGRRGSRYWSRGMVGQPRLHWGDQFVGQNQRVGNSQRTIRCRVVDCYKMNGEVWHVMRRPKRVGYR